MAVLKQSRSGLALRNAVVLDLGDLNRQAKRIIDDARAEAARILEDARQQADELVKGAAKVGKAQGFQEGLKQGCQQGREEGRRETFNGLKPQCESITSAWSEAIRQWERERSEFLQAAREDVLAFAITAARKLTMRLVHVDPTVVQDQVAEALSMLARPSSLAVTINPTDRSLVEEVLPELKAQLQSCAHIELCDDPSVSRGGCIITTTGGEVDATIDTQLDRIVEAIVPSHASDDES